MSKTLFDKVWDSHVVKHIENGPDVLFIDRHLVHEVTSPVAFLGLKNRGIRVLHPEKTFATADHNTPTINQHLPAFRLQVRICHSSSGMLICTFVPKNKLVYELVYKQCPVNTIS